MRILLTRLTGRERLANAQKILNAQGFQAGRPDGLVGRMTWRAILDFQKSIGAEAPDGALDKATYDALRASNGAEKFPDGHLYIRQGQRPIFDTPVELANPDKPLGNHLLTLPHVSNSGVSQWLSVSLDDAVSTAGLDAFLRFTIPEDVRKRIEQRLEPFSSIAISDAGLGRETGKGTDFVVVTYNPADH